MRRLVPFIGGVIMALGLGLSGMTQPGNVIAFLDVTGAWSPALLFTMVGAMAVYFVFYRFTRRLKRPLGAASFERGERGRIDRRLLLGALIFGVGWGLVGICPGPGLVALAGGDRHFFYFIAGMLGGMALLAATTESDTDSCG